MSQSEMTQEELAMYHRVNNLALAWVENPCVVKYVALYAAYAWVAQSAGDELADYLLGDLL